MARIAIRTTRRVMIAGQHTEAGQVVEVSPTIAFDLLDALAAELVNAADLATLIDARRAENRRVLSLRVTTPEPWGALR